MAGGSLIVRQGSFVAVEDNDGTDYEVTGTALVAKIEVDRGSIVVAGGPFASFAHLSNPIELLASPSYPYSGSDEVPAKLWAGESFIAIRRNILRRVSAEQRIAVVEMDAKRNVTILGNTNSGGDPSVSSGGAGIYVEGNGLASLDPGGGQVTCILFGLYGIGVFFSGPRLTYAVRSNWVSGSALPVYTLFVAAITTGGDGLTGTNNGNSNNDQNTSSLATAARSQ